MERHFVIAAKTDVGICKKVNQDSLTVKVAKTSKGEIAIAVLCDGMGGLTNGEIASAHVVKAFQKWFDTRLKNWLEKNMDKDALIKEWSRLIEECNFQIMKFGENEGEMLGTTLTAILLIENYYYIVHIGDCRIYEMKNEIRRITKDQTYVAREVELGHMTAEQAKNDSRKNVLLQCIGVDENINPVFLYGNIEEDTSFLLCSDGFRHVITEEEIMQYGKINLTGYDFTKYTRDEIRENMQKQLDYLVELNKNRGEKDNISAILIRSI